MIRCGLGVYGRAGKMPIGGLIQRGRSRAIAIALAEAQGMPTRAMISWRLLTARQPLSGSVVTQCSRSQLATMF